MCLMVISVMEENNSSKGRDKIRRNGAIRLGVGKVFQNHGIARQRSLSKSLPGKLKEAGVTRKF